MDKHIDCIKDNTNAECEQQKLAKNRFIEIVRKHSVCHSITNITKIAIGVSDFSALIFRVAIGVEKSTNHDNMTPFYYHNQENHQENHNGTENAQIHC